MKQCPFRVRINRKEWHTIAFIFKYYFHVKVSRWEKTFIIIYWWQIESLFDFLLITYDIVVATKPHARCIATSSVTIVINYFFSIFDHVEDDKTDENKISQSECSDPTILHLCNLRNNLFKKVNFNFVYEEISVTLTGALKNKITLYT